MKSILGASFGAMLAVIATVPTPASAGPFGHAIEFRDASAAPIVDVAMRRRPVAGRPVARRRGAIMVPLPLR